MGNTDPNPNALERARVVTPGASQTASRRHGLMGPFGYPAFAKSATGTYITLDNGDTVIDLAGANATVPLGYNHPKVVDAVREQLGVGGSLSLPSYLEAEASERLLSLLPFPAMVRWVRTGSEAVSAAVAIAKQVTNRCSVAVFPDSYHGWHPWTKLTTTIRDREIEDWKLLVPFACVLIESPRWHLVDETCVKRLTAIREACHQAGTLLVYDDVVYGFRYHNAGLQGSTMVRPDLACFSKALGNGIPVACVAGEPDIMEESSFRVSSTFGGEMLGLAAANAVLKLHQEEDICYQLLLSGENLMGLLLKALEGTPIAVNGTPQHFRFESPDPKRLDRFLQLCIGDEADTMRVDEGAKRVLVHRDANNINLEIDHVVAKQIAHTIELAAHRSER